MKTKNEIEAILRVKEELLQRFENDWKKAEHGSEEEDTLIRLSMEFQREVDLLKYILEVSE